MLATLLEKRFENALGKDCLTFQNFRLGGVQFMLPKRRFWKDEQKIQCGFSKDVSKVVSTRFGLRIVENSIESLCSPNEDFGRMNKR
jgi:hypothetical protein